MRAFNGNKSTSEAMPPNTMTGFNDGANWIRATKYQANNFISRAQLRTLVKRGNLFCVTYRKKLYVKDNNSSTNYDN